jgi:hypothetical protein
MKHDGGRILAKDMPSKTNGKVPITRHPLFPATVALWFGALFGIGSLAIRPTLIEALVVTLKIDAAIPSAAPPLGATGRILIALALAGLGGLLGAWLARRLARPKPVTVQRNRGAGLVGAAAARGVDTTSRRSSLALSDEGERRSEYREPAPLPGGATILDVSQFDLDGFEASDHRTPSEPDLEFAPEPAESRVPWQHEPVIERVPDGAQVFQPMADDIAETGSSPQEAEAPAFAPPAHEAMPGQVSRSSFIESIEAVSPVEDIVPSFENAEMRQHFAASVHAVDGDEPAASPAVDEQPAWIDPAYEETAIETPLPRLDDEIGERFEPIAPRVRPGSIFDREPAPALFARPFNQPVSRLAWDSVALDEKSDPAIMDAPAQTDDGAIEHAQVELGLSDGVDETASERIASAPLHALSPVELLERLALSMRRKRDEAATAPSVEISDAEPTNAAPPVETPAKPAEMQDDPVAPPVPVIPEALRPIGLEDEDDSDLLPVYVPPRHFGQAGTGSSGPAATTEAAVQIPEPAQVTPSEDLDEGYSSLLSLSRPSAGPQRFVRIEEPAPASTEIEPVVVFPSQEPKTGEGPFSRPTDERRAPSVDHAASRPDPEETDRALRTALANIQRMSGAA